MDNNHRRLNEAIRKVQDAFVLDEVPSKTRKICVGVDACQKQPHDVLEEVGDEDVFDHEDVAAVVDERPCRSVR